MKRIKYGLLSNKEYECKKDWPENVFAQGGTDGLVITSENKDLSADKVFSDINIAKEVVNTVLSNTPVTGTYRTAFFEVFSNEVPFVRGEGQTLEEAEERAWKIFNKYSECKHSFTRKNKRGEEKRDGSGYCEHCNMFKTDVFEPLEKCVVCNSPTYYHEDNSQWYCEYHCPRICGLKSEGRNSCNGEVYLTAKIHDMKDIGGFLCSKHLEELKEYYVKAEPQFKD